MTSHLGRGIWSCYLGREIRRDLEILKGEANLEYRTRWHILAFPGGIILISFHFISQA
jgi:hypothetical protein